MALTAPGLHVGAVVTTTVASAACHSFGAVLRPAGSLPENGPDLQCL